LLGGNKEEYVEDLLEEYDELREDYYAGLEERYFLDFDKAKKAKLEIDFDVCPAAPTPNQLGVNVVDNVSLEVIFPYID
jgi:5-methyltetrahydrofolate--homocysteine methyltransferase